MPAVEVILLQRVEKLGQMGDVVRVKPGFARNFLLPNKKALRANASNRKLFEANRTRIEADNASKKAEAEQASSGVAGKTVKCNLQAALLRQDTRSVRIVDASGRVVMSAQLT